MLGTVGVGAVGVGAVGVGAVGAVGAVGVARGRGKGSGRPGRPVQAQGRSRRRVGVQPQWVPSVQGAAQPKIDP